MNHSDFNDLLRRCFQAQATDYRPVGLPVGGGIRIGGDVGCATVFLSAAATAANMQDDAAAFEGWVVVLMAWCGVQRVQIDWEAPSDPGGRHYQRFLYRLRHFETLLGPDIVDVSARDRLAQCRVGNGVVATLNVAGLTDTVAKLSRPGSEADLEKRLAGANPPERDRLMAGLGLVRLDRQMPVGVFDGPPRRGGEIFTAGKSAIDLVGLDAQGALWLLELKTATNIKVGALSELFFYAMVLLDAAQGRIVFHDKMVGTRSTITPADIVAACRIHARVLAAACHPFLSPAVFDILTRAAEARGWPVDFAFQDLGCYLDQEHSP